MKVATVDYKAAQTPQKLTQSLIQTGFGIIANHPVSTALIETVYTEWQNFFTTQDKQRYLFNKKTQAGYFPLTISETAKGHQHKDLKEFFQFYPWGQLPDSLSANTLILYNQLSTLAAEVLGWLEANTPSEISAKFSMPLSQMIQESQQTMLRILHYPALTGLEEQGALRAAAHEDINLITLLPAATQPGLQVKDTQGKWHAVVCDANTIIVNVGDMLQLCSGHYYPSTTHRVINPQSSSSDKPRLSMPLFLHPRCDVVLSQQHTSASYLAERLTELGLN